MNLYRYASNSPTVGSDPLGTWNAWGHDSLINSAFGSSAPSGYGLSAHDIDTLQAASRAVDDRSGWGTSKQDVAEHAMSTAGESKEQAADNYNKFVDRQLQQAAKYEADGQHDKAIEALGEGMHALMDSTSPAHEGFQRWDGGGNLVNLLKAGIHALRELWPSEARREHSNELLRDYLDRFNELADKMRCDDPE